MTAPRPYCYPDENPQTENCIAMPENRIDPTAAPAVSPTGAPLIPVKAVPYVVAAITVLGTVGALPTMGISLIPVAICNGCLAAAAILGALAGVASPGLRKQG